MLWDFSFQVDESLTPDDRTKKHLQRKEKLKKFLDTHCQIRHYMFSILKCQSPDCQICEVPRLPPDIFKQIHHLPDPVPSGERYKSFTELYGKVNPSLDCLDEYKYPKSLASIGQG
jgi:hypothetical protein